MDNYNNSSGHFLKHPTFTMNNYSHLSDIPNSTLRSFYNTQFSSSALMASFANNNHIYTQQQQIEERQQLQHHCQQHQHFNNNYDSSLYSSAYAYTHSQYNPYAYQPLTPPPHQNDFGPSNIQSLDNSDKSNVFVKAEKIQNKLVGEYFKSLPRCILGTMEITTLR